MSHSGPMGGGNNQQLTEAMSIISLTNICFKSCVMRNKPSAQEPNEASGVLEYLGLEADKPWLLSSKETVCLHNCGISYVELKGLLHEQLLKDYTYIRKKNRTLFENL